MTDDPYRDLASAYALGALDEPDGGRFRGHVAGCEECAAEVARFGSVRDALPLSFAGQPPEAVTREQILDLAGAPALPLDLRAFAWEEVVPGARIHVLKEDAARGVRACLVWAQPGAQHPRHRHLGDENILVLQGGIRDHRGEYGPGQICRSRAGSSHTEEALPGEDCICYVVYYGALEMLPA